MKYEAPELHAVTSAIDVIQSCTIETNKTVTTHCDSQSLEGHVGYADWED